MRKNVRVLLFCVFFLLLFGSITWAVPVNFSSTAGFSGSQYASFYDSEPFDISDDTVDFFQPSPVDSVYFNDSFVVPAHAGSFSFWYDFILEAESDNYFSFCVDLHDGAGDHNLLEDNQIGPSSGRFFSYDFSSFSGMTIGIKWGLYGTPSIDPHDLSYVALYTVDLEFTSGNCSTPRGS